MPEQTPPLPTTLTPYLGSIDLGDPTLGGYLGQSISGLLGAVPAAGQYMTSMDYTTLFPALRAQYVAEVIQKYEAILGPSPELYQAALQSGALSQAQATALQHTSATTTGTLQQKYASQGGLRALAGPYQASRTTLLEQALSDIQSASQKASSDAYQLASTTTGQRVTALGQAGQIGANLVGSGVSRQNAKTAAEAAMAGNEGPGIEFPAPPAAPVPPKEPSIWEKILAGAIPASIAGGLGLAGRALAPSPQSDEEWAQRQHAREQRLAELRTGALPNLPLPADAGYANKPEHAGAADYAGYQPQQPQQNMASPYASGNFGYGPQSQSLEYLGYASPFANVGASYQAPGYSVAAAGYNGGFAPPSSYNWQQPLPQQPVYSQPQVDYSSYTQAPVDYSSYGDYGGYGGYDYGGYSAPSYDYSSYSQSPVDYSSYQPDYSQYNDYGGWG